jgi:hypothetical protein
LANKFAGMLLAIPGGAPIAAMLKAAGTIPKVNAPPIAADTSGFSFARLLAGMPDAPARRWDEEPPAPGAPARPDTPRGFGGLFGKLPTLDEEFGKLIDRLRQVNAGDGMTAWILGVKRMTQAIPARAMTPVERLNADNRRRAVAGLLPPGWRDTHPQRDRPGRLPDRFGGPRDAAAQRRAAFTLDIRRKKDEKDARDAARNLQRRNFGAAGALGGLLGGAFEKAAKKFGIGDDKAKFAGAAAAAGLFGLSGLGGALQRQARQKAAPRRRGQFGPVEPDYDTSKAPVEFINFDAMQKKLQSDIQAQEAKDTKSEMLLTGVYGALGGSATGDSVRGLLNDIKNKPAGPGFAV